MADSYNELFGLTDNHAGDAALIGNWPMQETSGMTCNDISTNGNNGTGTGWGSDVLITGTGPTGVGGYLASAWEFDGDSTIVTVLAAPAEQQTLLAWCAQDKASQTVTCMAANVASSTNDQTTIGQLNTTWAARVRSSGSFFSAIGQTVSAGTWTQLAGKFEQTNLRNIYVNGTPGTANTNNAAWRPYDTISIGALGDSTPGNYQDGLIAGAAVFDRVLLDSEIGEHRLGPELENTIQPTAPTGTPSVGQTLTANNGTWSLPAPFQSSDNGPKTYSYQWMTSATGLDAGTPIAGATNGTYTLQPADNGQYIACLVRGWNDGGYDAVADTLSTYTDQITGGGPIEPGEGSGAVIGIGSLSGAGESPAIAPNAGSGIVEGLGELIGQGFAPSIGIPGGSGTLTGLGELIGQGFAPTIGIPGGYGELIGIGLIEGAGFAPSVGVPGGLGIIRGFGYLEGQGLHIASGSGDIEAIGLLVGAGIDPTAVKEYQEYLEVANVIRSLKVKPVIYELKVR